jgi:putative membrane protein
MKKQLITYSVALALMAFTACSNNHPTNNADNKSAETGTPKSAEEHNDAKFKSDNEKDAQFVVDAVNDNLIEISLCDLATTRSTHPEVKELAKMLSEHHTKANNELTALAQKKNITVPSTTDLKNSEYNALNDKKGDDFDKAYYDKIVQMHKDEISRFEKAAQDCKDADIRNYASSQLPSLRAHLDRAMDDRKMADNWK